jgi:hypothetical protein
MGINEYPVLKETGIKMHIVTTTDMLRTRRNGILQLAAQHGAHNVRVFGSVARGEAGPTSDVDLVVEIDHGRSLLDLIEFSQELETFLQRKVDILTDQGLSPYIEERIHAEAVPL